MEKDVRESAQTVQKKPNSQKNIVGLIVLLAVIIILGVVGYMVLSGSNGGSEAIAVVNGEEITRSEFETRAARLTAIYEAQGTDVSSDEARSQIENQILEQLINETLILQEAEEAGITASPEEIEEAIAQDLASIGVQEPNQEELTNLLDEAGLTEEQYRQNMRNLVIINKYVDQNVPEDIEVSEAEIEAFYDQYAAEATEEVPPLEEVRQAIEAQLLAQERSIAVQEHVQALRDAADIQVNYTPQLEA